ncbi:alpha-L-fucosidase [Fragilaria crotonensis]|nr:alpha-L-fucosidase [Fragilaria crotonensis]
MAITIKIVILLFLVLVPRSHGYEATWESLDTRPLPAWYDDAKFGIFLHWGVFSVPAYGSEWFWDLWQGSNAQPRYAEFIAKTEGPRFSYPDYAHRFDATLYKPDEWAHIFARAGAQYVVLTSQAPRGIHHVGFEGHSFHLELERHGCGSETRFVGRSGEASQE